VREIETAGEIHGESGMDGPVLPEPTLRLDPRPAAQFIVETIMAAEPGSITLVPTSKRHAPAASGREWFAPSSPPSCPTRSDCAWRCGQRALPDHSLGFGSGWV